MTVEQEYQRILNGEAQRLAEHLDGTAEALLALTYAGYRAWTRNRRLHFPDGRRHALLLEILRYCADAHLLECLPFDLSRVEAIEHALDELYPRYARLRRASLSGRPPLHLRAERVAKRR